MALDELARHELHSRLRDAIGEQAAATLMDYLPPVGWADVATKRDLDALEQRIDARFDALDSRFDVVEARVEARIEALRADLRGEITTAITAQTRTFMFAVLGSNLTIAGIAFAAAALR